MDALMAISQTEAALTNTALPGSAMAERAAGESRELS
jgi:hypothetical protein